MDAPPAHGCNRLRVPAACRKSNELILSPLAKGGSRGGSTSQNGDVRV